MSPCLHPVSRSAVMKNKNHFLFTSLAAATISITHVARGQDFYLSLDGGTITTTNGTYQYLKGITMRNGARIEFGATGSSFAAVRA